MAIDISNVVVGKAYGIMSKGEKVRITVTKINKRASTVDIKNAAGKVLLNVAVDKLKGLQGRPAAGTEKPAAPAPAPAPKPAPAKPAAAPKAAAKNSPSYADVLERVRDIQNRMADVANELAEALEELNAMEPGESKPAAAPKGKGATKPMEEAEADEDEIEFD